MISIEWPQGYPTRLRYHRPMTSSPRVQSNPAFSPWKPFSMHFGHRLRSQPWSNRGRCGLNFPLCLILILLSLSHFCTAYRSKFHWDRNLSAGHPRRSQSSTSQGSTFNCLATSFRVILRFNPSPKPRNIKIFPKAKRTPGNWPFFGIRFYSFWIPGIWSIGISISFYKIFNLRSVIGTLQYSTAEKDLRISSSRNVIYK